MANIGITIAPWMLFFQQSFVVDKGMTEKDILFGKLDTASGALFTVLVAAFGIILTGTLLYKPWRADIESAAAASAVVVHNPFVGSYIRAQPDEMVETIQNEYLKIAKGKDEIMYIHVVDKDNKLLGIIDVKEILQADDEALLKGYHE